MYTRSNPLIDRPEGSDHDTLQQLAEYLAAKSGRTVVQEWANALNILNVTYDHDVLALDEDGHVVNLGRLEDVYPTPGTEQSDHELPSTI